MPNFAKVIKKIPVSWIIAVVIYLVSSASLRFISESANDLSSEILKLRREETIGGDLHQQSVNRERRMTVAKYCRDMGITKAYKGKARHYNHLSIYDKPRLYFTDSLQLIFCETPKCGTTQWRNLMLIIDGHLKGYAAGNEDNFPLSWAKNLLWRRFDASDVPAAHAADRRLQKYFKVMTTREPLERLVSAYRDKLESGQDHWYGKISKSIHSKMSHNSEESNASFEEFIDFILSTKNPASLDPHWKPYSLLCDPCTIHYDYIARMETIYDDATLITAHLHIKRDRIFNGSDVEQIQRRRRNIYHKYFDKLSHGKKISIFEYYRREYDMFGYEYPEFMAM